MVFKIFMILFLVSCSTTRTITKPVIISEDNDRHFFSPKPKPYFSPRIWDFMDKTFFRPFSHLFLLEKETESKNVNRLDEVPNSSWFNNRLSIKNMKKKEIIKGACKNQYSNLSLPWTVIKGKPDGANPGFIIKDNNGNISLLKFDSKDQPEVATSADVIGSLIYYAAGYNSPCNQIVYFDREDLKVSPDATKKNELGDKVQLLKGDVDKILSHAIKNNQGQLRAMRSHFIKGSPIGPWRYHGLRNDDFNDVIDHEDRREIRAAKVIASWINHFDTRENNTLDMWIQSPSDDSKGYVKHYYIDFGDSLGSRWDWDGISRRHGHSHHIDLTHLVEDFFSLGLIQRPWHKRYYGRTGGTLGYFNIDHFTPRDWKSGYRNPAFDNMTEHDAAWMARIISNFSDNDIDGIVDQAKIQNDFLANEVKRILKGRRNKITQDWSRKVPNLSKIEFNNNELCFRDPIVSLGLIDPKIRRYILFTWNDGAPKLIFNGRYTTNRNGENCLKIENEYKEKLKIKLVTTELYKSKNGFDIIPNRAPIEIDLLKKGDITRIRRHIKPDFELPISRYSNPLKTRHQFNEDSPDLYLDEEHL